jgi:hypothetical protein
LLNSLTPWPLTPHSPLLCVLCLVCWATTAAAQEARIPTYSFILCIVIALVCGPPGVRVFGKDEAVYRREFAANHNRLAYFIGVDIVNCYRILLTSVTFTGTLVISFQMQENYYKFWLSFMLCSYAMHGLAYISSILVRSQQSESVPWFVAFQWLICCIHFNDKKMFQFVIYQCLLILWQCSRHCCWPHTRCWMVLDLSVRHSGHQWKRSYSSWHEQDVNPSHTSHFTHTHTHTSQWYVMLIKLGSMIWHDMTW